jgi:lipid II:glycine glycyltransferase (peptidoglycan interpeptide bridge formation enzyme)
MTLMVRPAQPADRARWDTFVASRPEADPMQLWAWGEATALERERPMRLLAEREDGSVAGVAAMLVRATALARSIAYVPHGPVWDRDASDAEAVLRVLLTGVRTLGREERAIVAKLDPRAAAADQSDSLAAALRRRGIRRARHDLQAPSTRIIDLLGGGEALAATWSGSARRHVRQAEKRGVTAGVDTTGSSDAIAAFHGIYRETGERGRFRTRSLEFLERFARELGPGNLTISIARLDGIPIAGIVAPRVADRAYYFWAASLRAPELERAYGGYAALSSLMTSLAAGGVRTLDLWGVAEEGDPDADKSWAGFSAFKRSWGGVPLRHPGTFDLIVDRFWYSLRDMRERVGERLGG